MSLQLQVDIPRDIFEAVRETSKSSAFMRRAFKQNTRRVGLQMLSELRRNPGPVRRPIQWASPVQRAAFFASDGFGKGIPTQRTGRLRDSWALEYNYGQSDNFMEIRNDTPYAPYVVGDWQQPFHRNTGYPLFAEVVGRYQRTLEDVLIDTWVVVVDEAVQR